MENKGNKVCKDGYLLPCYCDGVKVFCPTENKCMDYPVVCDAEMNETDMKVTTIGTIMARVTGALAFVFVLFGVVLVIVDGMTSYAGTSVASQITPSTWGSENVALASIGIGLIALLFTVVVMLVETNRGTRKLVR